MNLYIIRHAIAAEPGGPGFVDDSQRPITEKGRAKMQAIARGLRALDLNFDLIISSPYLRARETAEILADIFKMKTKLVLSENLIPMSEPHSLISEIGAKYSVNSLAVVGHEPVLSALISTLLAGTPGVLINMKKGGVCCLALDKLGPAGRAQLEWLLTPSQLLILGE